MKEFADDNFKFDEKGRKFFNRVENTVGKEEIARYEQFLLFPQCFQRLVLQTCKKQIVFAREDNIVRKGENIGYMEFAFGKVVEK